MKVFNDKMGHILLFEIFFLLEFLCFSSIQIIYIYTHGSFWLGIDKVEWKIIDRSKGKQIESITIIEIFSYTRTIINFFQNYFWSISLMITISFQMLSSNRKILQGISFLLEIFVVNHRCTLLWQLWHLHNCTIKLK